ncbi:hypothetical protein M9Y10_022904 [Tritrichomonas musculus]|uniref:Uncharacterized protein n=1 Tax=Tritrichomonas musculus TaxID=1915356 RepID=A0ABR2KWY0_9EUKA
MSLPCTVSTRNGQTFIEGTHQNIVSVQNELRRILKLDPNVPLNSIKLVPDMESAKKITPKIKKAIHLIHPDIDATKSTDEQLISNESLGLKYLEAAAKVKKPDINSFIVEVCKVPLVVASFILELFHVSKENPHYVNKILGRDSVHMIYCPIPVYVRFQFVEEYTISLKVANLLTLPANITLKLVSNLVHSISDMPLIVTHFKDVDAEGFDNGDVHTFAHKNKKDNHIVVLKSDDNFSNDGTYRSFNLYGALLTEPNDQFIKNYHDSCEKIFFSITRRECMECHQIISDAQKDDECVSYVHDGNRIAFDDGQMEHKSEDENGKAITLVRYSCCPDVESVLEDPMSGCIAVSHGNHKTARDSDLSSWSEDKITTIKSL